MYALSPARFDASGPFVMRYQTNRTYPFSPVLCGERGGDGVATVPGVDPVALR